MSTLPIPGGILGTMSPAYGAATGQGLGGMMPMLSPALMAAMALKGKGGGAAPGEAIGAVEAPQAPTLATNAQPAPAPAMEQPNLGNSPLGAEGGPGLSGVMDTANAGVQAKPRGILGTIGDGLKDPSIKAALMRAAGATFDGGIGKGILAGAGYYDQRRQEAEQQANADRDYSLKQRGVDQEDRRISNQDRQFYTGDTTQRYGIDTNAGVAVRGQNVDERNNIRSNGTARANNHEDNVTSRANNIDSNNTAITTNREDNATARDVATGRDATDVQVATIGAGGRNRLAPDKALDGLYGILPGMLGTTDAAGVDKALQSSPDLQAQLVDAYTTAWGDGTGDAMQRAQKAVAGVLGDGASYTDDNSPYIPFHGSPEITRGKPRASGGGGGNQSTAAPAAPKKGDRVDGYTYQGGDPADPRSWSK